MPRLFRKLPLFSLAAGCAAIFAWGSGSMHAAPVFQVFALKAEANAAEVEFDEKRPLLIVRNVRDVRADYERGTVTVALKDDDAKAFAQLTRQFTGRLLLLKGADSAMEVMRIRGAIEDGHLLFHPVQDAPMFGYLVSRFRLGPMGNNLSANVAANAARPQPLRTSRHTPGEQTAERRPATGSPAGKRADGRGDLER